MGDYMEMEREEKYYGKHTERLAELEKVRALQEKVVMRMLERSIEGSEAPKEPILRSLSSLFQCCVGGNGGSTPEQGLPRMSSCT